MVSYRREMRDANVQCRGKERVEIVCKFGIMHTKTMVHINSLLNHWAAGELQLTVIHPLFLISLFLAVRDLIAEPCRVGRFRGQIKPF